MKFYCKMIRAKGEKTGLKERRFYYPPFPEKGALQRGDVFEKAVGRGGIVGLRYKANI